METLKNYINGTWLSSSSGILEWDINPANNEDRICQYYLSTAVDMKDAIQSAFDAQPYWEHMLPSKRGSLLRKASILLEEEIEVIAADLTREEGKTLREARGEVARAVAILRYYGDETDRLFGKTYPSQRDNVIGFTVRKPIGVIGVITPWNFPMAIPVWKIAPALAAGNTVVWKCARNTPLTGFNLMKIFHRAGIPPGVVNMIIGRGDELGPILVKNPAVRGISFTGSREVGKKINLMASDKIMKIQLEMGGKNPTIIAPDAPLDKAADIVIDAAFLSAGQKCTATSRVIVHKDIYEDFRDILVEKTKKLKVGDPTKPDTVICPIIDITQHGKILKYIEIGKSEGARLLCGGKVPENEECAKGYFVEPTVFDEVTPDMTIATEEIFGPVIAMIKAVSIDEAISIANMTEFGLSASMITKDIGNAFRYLHEIEAGLVTVNLPSAGLEYQMPFGGLKDSSSGWREQGDMAIEFYTHLKTVYLKWDI